MTECLDGHPLLVTTPPLGGTLGVISRIVETVVGSLDAKGIVHPNTSQSLHV